MPSLPSIDTDFLLAFLADLLNTPSPTGYAEAAVARTREALQGYPDLSFRETNKGALLATWPGLSADQPRALTAHVDTLGAMVKEIKANGRLKLTKIGGFAWNTVEGEGCRVFTADGKTVRGALLLAKASSHVYGVQVNDLKRDDENMEVRLDARVTNADETRALGIQVGDFVAFDPRVEITEGFVRSRHLDDKACAACLVAAVKALHDAGLQPAQRTYLLFSNYEEVGHGAAAGIPRDAVELVAVDMAAVGDGQASDEYHATLCVKDSGGPYHHGLSQRMRRLAEENGIPYVTDIYPFYGSDGEAYWHAGGDVAVALIG
ncbi:MAG TPA: M42 family metallopeptidase, partial [Anaerolineaceae bacterium]|nr:M42 family metallopeptidase [Anaerolineaceae bacterium]